MSHQVTPETIKKIYEFAKNGLTKTQIASNLGWGISTLYEKGKKNPDILDACEKGAAHGINTIANALFMKAEQGDNTCMIFYLKCRAGWKETAVFENHDATYEDLIIDSDRDPVEVARQYKKMMG